MDKKTDGVIPLSDEELIMRSTTLPTYWKRVMMSIILQKDKEIENLRSIAETQQSVSLERYTSLQQKDTEIKNLEKALSLAKSEVGKNIKEVYLVAKSIGRAAFIPVVACFSESDANRCRDVFNEAESNSLEREETFRYEVIMVEAQSGFVRPKPIVLSPKMHKCPECGEQVVAGKPYCPSCGLRMDVSE